MGLVQRKPYKERVYPKKTKNELLNAGLLVVNKPKGPFSYEITKSVKKLLDASKTGHAGTLDPNATGVLPVGVNQGCNLLQAISHAPKQYEGVMHVHSEVSLSRVIEASKQFIGVIKQLPPLRSAVKRAVRERVVYSLTVDDMRGRDVFFTIDCEAGTYVRRVCTEWGEAMGSKAHLKELVRTRAGPYTLKDATHYDTISLDPLKYLKPIETAVEHLPHVWLDDDTIESLSHGSQPFLPGVYKYETGIMKDALIALMTPSQELAAIATALMLDEDYKKTKGQIAKLERVFISRN